MASKKVRLVSLPVMKPPFPRTGGRGLSPAGEMAQIINGDAMRLVTYIEFQPDGKPRGNHFHRQKMEVIYIIKGHLKVFFEDLDTGELQTIEMRTGDMVYVQPNCAHVYVAKEYTQALELNEVPYDSADTIPYEVDMNPPRQRNR
jgi:uncharacterized RmlC-like cupin family protein